MGEHNLKKKKPSRASKHQVLTEEFLDAMPALVWTLDYMGRLNWCGYKWLDYTGMSKEASQNYGWILSLHESERTRMFMLLEQALRTGEELQGSFQLYSRVKDSFAPFHVRFGPPALKRHEARWIALAVPMLDEGKAIADASQALEAAELAMWDWDVQTSTVFWNEQHFRLLGITDRPVNITADYFLKYVHEDDRLRVSSSLTAGITNNKFFREEFRIIREDDKQVRWMLGFGRVVLNERLSGIRVVGVMADITEKKVAEKEKDEFFSLAAEKLRTPVSSIRSYSKILREATEEQGKIYSLLEMTAVDKLVNQAGHLEELVRQFPNYINSHASVGELQIQDLNLCDLARSSVEEYRILVSDREFLSDLVIPAFVRADRSSIERIVGNMLENAVKFSPSGSAIWVSVTMDANHVRFSVKDNGIGIPMEMQQRIFEPFFAKINNIGRREMGVGLGLYVSKGIIETLGGEMGVRSELGKGSIFYFTLPTSSSKSGV